MQVDSYKILSFGEMIEKYASGGAVLYGRKNTKRNVPKVLGNLTHATIRDHISVQETPRFALNLQNVTPYFNGAVIKNNEKEIIKSFYIHHQHHDHAPWSWRERYASTTLIPPSKILEGKTLYLSDIWWESYYHFQVDILGKLMVAYECGSFLDFDHIMLPGNPPPYILEMLSYLGILPKIRIEPHEPIIYSNLTIPSYCASGDGYISGDLVSFLKNNLMKNVHVESRKNKIYISRKNAGWRRVINENEIEEVLRKEGFKILFNEEMTVKDQITEFSNASVVIAPHGAGLTNLIYAQEGTKVLEIFSNDYVHKCYAELAGEINLDYYYAVFPVHEQRPKDIWFDLKILDQFLD